MVKVKIPASSANLGPGFDCFGIAWQCWNEIEFDKSDELIITGCDDAYKNENNLAFVAYRRTLKEAGIDVKGAVINFGRTDIPVSRGMGSSAALICGAVVAANELYDLGFSKELLFRLATEVEGHPDNIAPALFGGFTASTMNGDQPVTGFFPVSDKLFFTCLIPDFELSTTLSRSVLPQSYTKADAVFNVSRAVLVTRAMADGNAELLSVAMEDKIHQPYRFKLIDGIDDARAIAMDCGAAAMCISGAGSTLLAVGSSPIVGEKLKEKITERFPGWRVLPVELDMRGTVII